MLGDVFEFMNSCFPNQKLKLRIGNVELGEHEIKELEKQKKAKEEAKEANNEQRSD